MSKPTDILKVRLSRDHYQNGLKKKSGTVLRVTRWTADWLIARGAARKIK